MEGSGEVEILDRQQGPKAQRHKTGNILKAEYISGFWLRDSPNLSPLTHFVQGDNVLKNLPPFDQNEELHSSNDQVSAMSE